MTAGSGFPGPDPALPLQPVPVPHCSHCKRLFPYI